jgi:hypothetical protein
MYGLIVLVAVVVYLALLIFATRSAFRWAQKRGWSRRKSLAVAAGGFLVIYLPVFWDHIPTLATHRYSCATEAGFREYKTIEQWKKENPGVAETLVATKDLSRLIRQGDMQNYTETETLNQRFTWVSRKTGPHPVNRWRWENEIRDSKTNEAIAKSIDFSSGNGFIGGASVPMKFWLQLGYCEGGDIHGSKMYSIRAMAKNIGKKE